MNTGKQAFRPLEDCACELEAMVVLNTRPMPLNQTKGLEWSMRNGWAGPGLQNVGD